MQVETLQMAWKEKGMPELGDSITVIPTRKRSQEITILIAFNRTIRVQSGGADR